MVRRFIGFILMMSFCGALQAQGNFFSLGIGPSAVYVDNNSGVYQDFKFQIQPAVTLSVSKQMNEHLAVRGSLGTQLMKSGEYDLSKVKRLSDWGNKDQAYEFKGIGYSADVMPIFTTNPNETGMLMSTIQFYGGLGFGLMFVQREQKTLKNGIVENGELVEGDFITSDETSLIPYIPVRTGISTNSGGDWDLALEFVLMVATNSNLDGNSIKHNRFGPDMSGQILFTVKRYFGKAW